jgi:diguanylate cyclase (GGDEF)-like protein
MSQVNDVQMSQDISKRIALPDIENNEIRQLQEHMNNMLSAIEADQVQLLEDEQAKRAWLEDAVAKRTAALQVSNEKLKELATRDSLTKVLNRGSFFETAQHLLTLSQRQKSPASFVLMDLDLFKSINDTYGHFIGDQVLVHFTNTIQTLVRKSDLIGRVGGEEFAVYLPDTDEKDALNIAEKIRAEVARSILDVEGKQVNYTVSIGVETSYLEEQSIGDLFKRADLKLYGAKDKGRNCVEN